MGDLARLVSKALRLPASGCFNAGSGQGRSVREIVALCAETTGRALRPVHRPGRGFDVPRIVLDISRVREATGWSPRTGLREGMRDSWNWIQAQGGEGRLRLLAAQSSSFSSEAP